MLDSNSLNFISMAIGYKTITGKGFSSSFRFVSQNQYPLHMQQQQQGQAFSK